MKKPKVLAPMSLIVLLMLSSSVQGAGDGITESAKNVCQDPFLDLRERASREIAMQNFRAANILINEVLEKAPRDSVARKLIAADQQELTVKVKIAREVMSGNAIKIKKHRDEIGSLNEKLQEKKKERERLAAQEAEQKAEDKTNEAESIKKLEALKKKKTDAAARMKAAENKRKEHEKDAIDEREDLEKKLREFDKQIAAKKAQKVTLDGAERIRHEIREIEAKKSEVGREKQELDSERRVFEDEERRARQEMEGAEREIQYIELGKKFDSLRTLRASNDHEITSLERQIEMWQGQVTSLTHQNEQLKTRLPE